MAARFCVVYRMGGRDNFSWHRSMAFAKREDAERARKLVDQGGRTAMIENFDQSVAIGLPETYEYEQLDGAAYFSEVREQNFGDVPLSKFNNRHED